MSMTIRLGRFEAYFEHHATIPRGGLFQIKRNARGELFVDLLWLSIIISDLKRVREYFESGGYDKITIEGGREPPQRSP